VTWVKLCGLRTAADVAAAVEAGADAVGFVAAVESPRRVTPAEAAALGTGIPLLRFLVTVDLGPDELLAAAAESGVDGVQPHGSQADAAAAAALDVGLRVLFPVPVVDEIDLGGVPEGATPLLDAAVSGRHGGTGRAFPWHLAGGLARPVVLAGGLSSDTVAEAIRIAKPWGVDVSSGIESSPGVKDHDEMRRFVEAVR
jgi:phosphoribosylanthranilate isomerase